MADRFFNSILVPTDFSEKSLIALNHSTNFAKVLNCNITLLHVVEEVGYLAKFFTEKQSAELMKAVQENMNDMILRLSKEASVVINPMIEKGKIYTTIVSVAERINARFVMLGSNSNALGEQKPYIGSNTARVVREAVCPVVIYHNDYTKTHDCRNIVLPLDLTKQTVQKVEKAIEIARYFGATIRVISAVLTNEEDVVSLLKKQIKDVQHYIEERNVYCTSEIIYAENSLSEAILKYSKDVKADMIMIMTQQERNWVQYFVGSSAQEILRNAKVPVMTILPDSVDISKVVIVKDVEKQIV